MAVLSEVAAWKTPIMCQAATRRASRTSGTIGASTRGGARFDRRHMGARHVAGGVAVDCSSTGLLPRHFHIHVRFMLPGGGKLRTFYL